MRLSKSFWIQLPCSNVGLCWGSLTIRITHMLTSPEIIHIRHPPSSFFLRHLSQPERTTISKTNTKRSSSPPVRIQPSKSQSLQPTTQTPQNSLTNNQTTIISHILIAIIAFAAGILCTKMASYYYVQVSVAWDRHEDFEFLQWQK